MWLILKGWARNSPVPILIVAAAILVGWLAARLALLTPIPFVQAHSRGFALIVRGLVTAGIILIFWRRFVPDLLLFVLFRPDRRAASSDVNSYIVPPSPTPAPQAPDAASGGASVRLPSITPPMPAPPAPKPVVSMAYDVPGTTPLDAVQFSLTAPLSSPPGSTFELVFWAHLDSLREEVLRRAKQAVPATVDLLFKSEGPFQLRRGVTLSVGISVQGFMVTPKHKPVLWAGEIGSAGFLIAVPKDALEGAHPATAAIRLNGSQIARMHFTLSVETKPGTSIATAIAANVTVFKKAFASYASQDRDQVIGRVQGMESAFKGLKVFVDVVSLRSGQDWEKELWKRIPEADVFYLFWCRHAKESLWVQKEWQCALATRGLDYIDPVPLESADLAHPPPELASKHFNDPLLRFLDRNPHQEIR